MPPRHQSGYGEIMKTGKVPENILKRSVLGQIRTKRKDVAGGAGPGEDCAIFLPPGAGSGGIAVCMQETAVALEDERYDFGGAGLRLTMGHLIQKCANNLAASAARPSALLITLLLPENTEEKTLKALMAEAENKCRELSLEIAGGQTRVCAAVSAPIAVASGYGVCLESACCRDKGFAGRAEPGQDIVVSKWIGLEGTALLAGYNREGLLSRYPAWLVDEASGFGRYLSVLPEAEAALEAGVCAMHDASEGGIFGALWELAEGGGVGLSVDMRSLPLRQETVEVCEFCNVDPYRLMSGGCLVMTAKDGPGLAAVLRERQIPAAVVGRVTEGSDRILWKDGEVRYLDRAGRDEIHRYLSNIICRKETGKQKGDEK